MFQLRDIAFFVYIFACYNGFINVLVMMKNKQKVVYEEKVYLFIIWTLIGIGIEFIVTLQGSSWHGLSFIFVKYVVLLSLFPFGAGLILFYGETKRDNPLLCIIAAVVLLLLANASSLIYWFLPNLFNINLGISSQYVMLNLYIPVLSFGAAYYASKIKS